MPNRHFLKWLSSNFNNFCITNQFDLKDSRKKKYKGHKSDDTADPTRDGVHVQAEQEMIKMVKIMLLDALVSLDFKL